MLGLKIEVSDTFGFIIRMGRKKGGLLVEIVKHQGKIISLGLRKLTTKYALCLHVEHIHMTIKNKHYSLGSREMCFLVLILVFTT